MAMDEAELKELRGTLDSQRRNPRRLTVPRACEYARASTTTQLMSNPDREIKAIHQTEINNRGKAMVAVNGSGSQKRDN